jgi:hypothetical protein
MSDKSLPDIAVLRQLLRYEPDTGKLYWLSRPMSMFPKSQQANTWNTKNAGRETFTLVHKGYYQGTIFNAKFRAHRVAWALYYGRWPERHLDHINGVRTDNRIENLREVERSENQRNQKRRTDNTSGATGVSWYVLQGKWVAEIYVDGKKKNLGYFDTYEEAISARKLAEVTHGYHENHGRY